VLDLLKRRVTLRGEEIHLGPTEYKLLSELATHPGELLTFDVLMEKIKGAAESAKPKHYIQVYINTLRKKLQDDPVASMTKPLYIFSEPGVGYRFTDVEPKG
jgi:two-component system KDP operon response regulator KdpE